MLYIQWWPRSLPVVNKTYTFYKQTTFRGPSIQHPSGIFTPSPLTLHPGDCAGKAWGLLKILMCKAFAFSDLYQNDLPLPCGLRVLTGIPDIDIPLYQHIQKYIPKWNHISLVPDSMYIINVYLYIWDIYSISLYISLSYIIYISRMKWYPLLSRGIRRYLLSGPSTHACASKGQKILVGPVTKPLPSNIGVSVHFLVVRSLQKLKRVGRLPTSVRKRFIYHEKTTIEKSYLEEVEPLV